MAYDSLGRYELNNDLGSFRDSILIMKKAVSVDSGHFLERLRYIKLKQIAPDPLKAYIKSAVVPPAPATRDDLMTPAWSQYLLDLPKRKSPHGWVTCQPHEEDAELRGKSDIRNKIWHNLFFKREHHSIENEPFWFNVLKTNRATRSLPDVLLRTRNSTDDVAASPSASSFTSQSCSWCSSASCATSVSLAKSASCDSDCSICFIKQ